MEIDETNDTDFTVTEKREHEFIQCAACGHRGQVKDFYNSSVHSNFKICPECGTVRCLCNGNANYRREVTVFRR